jgi:hypothetical protein
MPEGTLSQAMQMQTQSSCKGKRRSWSFNIQSQVTATSSTQPSYMRNTVIPKNQSNAYTVSLRLELPEMNHVRQMS